METRGVNQFVSQLTLQWMEENGQPQSQTFYGGQPSKSPGTIRIGRDPNQCDLVLQNPTVSGLHVEIFWELHQGFCLRNLRESNPPKVDGKRLYQGHWPLQEGSQIKLGRVTLGVSVIECPSPVQPPPKPDPSSPDASKAPVYGLRCPNCQRHCTYEQARLGCPWCGTSLAGAASVLLSDAQ